MHLSALSLSSYRIGFCFHMYMAPSQMHCYGWNETFCGRGTPCNADSNLKNFLYQIDCVQGSCSAFVIDIRIALVVGKGLLGSVQERLSLHKDQKTTSYVLFAIRLGYAFIEFVRLEIRTKTFTI